MIVSVYPKIILIIYRSVTAIIWIFVMVIFGNESQSKDYATCQTTVVELDQKIDSGLYSNQYFVIQEPITVVGVTLLY